MKHWVRWLLLACVVGALGGVALAADIGFRYDANDSGRIEWGELETAARDYYDGEIERDDAVDLVLRYIGDVPVATPVPPRAEPTPSQTPDPPAYDTFSCHKPKHGAFYGSDGVELVRYQREIWADVTYINPDSAEWEYGFAVLLKAYWDDYVKLVRYVVNDEGAWVLRGESRGSDYVYGMGFLSDQDIPFNFGSGARNQLTYKGRVLQPGPSYSINGGYSHEAELLVNGHAVEIETNQIINTWSDGSYARSRKLWSTAHQQHYEHLCTALAEDSDAQH